MLSVEQAEEGLDAQAQRIGLIGHSHVSLFFARAEEAGAAKPKARKPATGRCSASRAAPGC